VLCQAKHYAAYGHLAHDTLPVDLSETTLRDVRLGHACVCVCVCVSVCLWLSVGELCEWCLYICAV
jgi:hypothetical protein